MRIVIGENRRDAISTIQRKLGPLTSRPIAENTFWELAKEKKITLNEEGQYLMEDESEEGLRKTAKKTMMSGMRPRTGYTYKPKSHFSKFPSNNPTVSKMAAMKSMKSALSPDLPANLGDNPDESQ